VAESALDLRLGKERAQADLSAGPLQPELREGRHQRGQHEGAQQGARERQPHERPHHLRPRRACCRGYNFTRSRLSAEFLEFCNEHKNTGGKIMKNAAKSMLLSVSVFSILFICASLRAETIVETEKLRDKVSQLEGQLEIEKLKTRVAELELQTGDRKKKELAINRVELNFSGNIPNALETAVPNLEVSGAYGFEGRVGVNFTDWFQFDFVGGFMKSDAKNIVTQSFSFTSQRIEQNATSEVLFIAPKIRFQSYLNRYIQPFLDMGVGYYRESLKGTTIATFTFSPPFSGSSKFTSPLKRNLNGAGINAGFGINIGPKKGRVKGVVKAEFHKIFDDAFTMSSIISPGAGIVISF
jgi:hypothetical protein